ncbi:MAG: TM2 domain-containing protein [Holophaga sp.]|nr:TM2 domain-containing protein [Holophaga sp.]
MFCPNCGNEVADHAVVCVKCGGALKSQTAAAFDPAAKSKMAFILLGIFLGGLGIHNFYAGYTGKGVAQLLISVLTCGFGSIISWIWAIVEVCTIQVDATGKPFTN